MIFVDSDHLSVLIDSRHALRDQLLNRMRSAAETVAVPIVCVEEQLRGWLAEIRRIHDVRKQIVPYARLAKVIDFFREWRIIDWNDAAADWFKELRSQPVRIGTQDLKIAAMALAHDALLLSANLRDFEKVPRLRIEDWLYG